MPGIDLDAGVVVAGGASAITQGVITDSKCVFRQSNGHVLALSISADAKTIYVTEWNPTDNSVVRRTSKATSSGEVINRIVGALWANDDLSIFYGSNDRVKIRHAVYDTSAHTIGAWEIVRSYDGVLCDAWDADVSDGGMVVCVLNQYNPTSNYHSSTIHTRPVGATTWSQIYEHNNFNWTNYSRACEGMAVSCLGSNGGRNVIYAVGRGYHKTTAGAAGKDLGIQIRGLRINETTGDKVGDGGENIYGNYMAGDSDANSNTPNNRLINTYRTSGNDFIMAMAHREGAKRFGTLGMNYNAGTWTLKYGQKVVAASLPIINRAATAFDGKNMTFGFSASYTGASPRLHNYICKNADTGNNWSANGIYQFDSVGDNDLGLGSMGGRNYQVGQNYFMWQYGQSGATYLNKSRISYSAVPTNLPFSGGQALKALIAPADGSVQTAQPDLEYSVSVDAYASQSKYKMEFQFATDSLYTTSLKDYVQSDTLAKVVTGKPQAGYRQTFKDTLPKTYTLGGSAPWFMRGRLIDEWGNVGPWLGDNSFHIQHPPTSTPVFPLNSSFIIYGSGTVTFRWAFSDPSDGDYQTAYEINVSSIAADGTVSTVIATGKVASSDPFYVADLTGYKETPLVWQVRVWDSDDTVGAWSQNINFTLTDAPTAIISYPGTGETIDTGVPVIQFTPTAGGGRTVKDYTLTITQNGVVVWSKRTYGPWDSGTPLQLKVPQGYLQNNQSYSLQITVTDSGNMQGTSYLVPFTVAWIPPAGPVNFSVDDSFYDQEDEGYVRLNWSGDSRDVDFYAWAVYRQDSLIDPYSYEVLDVGPTNLIGIVYDSLDTYDYNDFFAPSGYQCTYTVHQLVNRDGQEIESTNADDTVTVQPMSDGYWLINPTSDNMNADAFKLSIVTGDSFTDEQEESEFTVLGRGRVVNKGQLLGYNGTLEVRLRDTGGTSARQKRLRLKQLKESEASLWLRNPFGDTFRVNVSNISITRIAGVGVSEFCDVSIPYAEVAK